MNREKCVRGGCPIPRLACTLRKAGALYAKLCREPAAHLWIVAL